MSLLDRLRKRLSRSSSGLASGLDAVVAAGQDDERTESDLPEAVPPASRERSEGMIGRLASGLGKLRNPLSRRMDSAMREEIEELLIMADMGAETSRHLAEGLAGRRLGRHVTAAEVRQHLADDLADRLSRVEMPLATGADRPHVILMVGVNGSGKTTTIGKLASRFRKAGQAVMIAAADTFRAAAVEQLQIWGERVGVPVVTGSLGADPASVAYAGFRAAQAAGADVLLIDTAGRMQNRKDLMNELAKIIRVLRKLYAAAPHQTLLVVDATTGQNALNQVAVFHEIAAVSGLVMTKLDGTARGGILVAISDRFGLPIHAIGIGEGVEDLTDFDARDFALALTASDAES